MRSPRVPHGVLDRAPVPALRLASGLALALLCLLATAGPFALPARGETEAKPAPKAELSSWMLEEFDWGDSETLVKESIDYAPNYFCFTSRGECRVVQVRVDGEELLARFQYFEEGLWRMAFITPPLDLETAVQHGPRVLNTLTNHVKRHRGEPAYSKERPEIAEIGEGTHVLHRWKTETSVIEVVLVRRGSRYFVGAYFADPVRGAKALASAVDPTAPPRRPDGSLPVPRP